MKQPMYSNRFNDPGVNWRKMSVGVEHDTHVYIYKTPFHSWSQESGTHMWCSYVIKQFFKYKEEVWLQDRFNGRTASCHLFLCWHAWRSWLCVCFWTSGIRTHLRRLASAASCLYCCGHLERSWVKGNVLNVLIPEQISVRISFLNLDWNDHHHHPRHQIWERQNLWALWIRRPRSSWKETFEVTTYFSCF